MIRRERGAVVGEGHTLDETYHLHRLVGEGGMGAVYEATHRRLAGRYAIKVLLRELSERPDVRARFEREARVTSLLQHPNIVQVIDHNVTHDGTSYLVMEYLAGDSLAARLVRDGRLAVPAVVDIVDQLAAGLAAAHAREIVHRDLKPDNVFLLPVEGRATELVKILDFGISKVSWGRDAMDREICGTPQYMAPEQVEGRVGDVDASTDQYALAVIAYELLTGVNPFLAETIEEVFARVATATVPSTGIGAAVDAVLWRALAKEQAHRFPSVTAFAEAFRAAALVPVAPPVVALVPAVSPLPARRARRRARDPRLVVAAGVALTITSFLGTGAAHRAQRPAPTTRNADVSAAEATAALPAPAVPPAPVPAPILTESMVPAVAVSASSPAEPTRPRSRHVVRKPAEARKALADRPMFTIPAAPVVRPPSPVLKPDEDATLPPSDL
jgi:serine/threonine-protein kinase